MEKSVKKCKLPGSTTVVMAEIENKSVESKEATLKTCNLGDSGYMLLRPKDTDSEILFKSKSQQHRFNMPFQVAPPTVHLCPAGHACLHHMPQHIARHMAAKFFNKHWPFRPRPHQAHLAPKHIPELRELIE